MNSLYKTIAIAVAISQSAFAYGQNSDGTRSNQFKISPARLIDLVNPGVELGFEKFHAGYFSSQIGIAYMKDFFNVTVFDDYRGIRFSLEEKYFRLPKKSHHTYYSVECVYLNVNYVDASSYRKDTFSFTPSYLDTFKVAKQTISFNLKYGIQIQVKRFCIDLFAGIGLKYKMVVRRGVDDPNAHEITAIDPNAYDMASKEGNHLGINLPINIKLGFSFW